MNISAIANYGVLNRQLSKSEKWVTFYGLFFFGFTCVYNLLKPSSALLEIGSAFGLGLDTVGYVMSVFAFATLALAYPGTWLMRTMGIKSSLVLSIVITIIGSVVGFVSVTPELFLFSRVLEGMGFGLICVIGPNIMPRLFEPEKQGLVMGIWSQWVACGTVLAFFAAPIIYQVASWQGLWILSLVFEAIAVVWLLAGVKFSKVPENVLALGGDTLGKKLVIKGKMYFGISLLVSVAFLVWTFVYLDDINGFYPTFLQEFKGWDMQVASLPTLVLAAITIPLGIVFGAIMGKTRTCKWFLVFGYLLVAASVITVGYTSSGDVIGPWVFAILMGVAASAVPTATRSIIPMLCKDPSKTDWSLATMAFVTGVGQLFSGLYGSIVADIGWADAAIFVLAPCAIVSAAICLFLKSDHKLAAEDAAIVDIAK
ncbi:MAG: MFS transporter [Coriobacteriales bacterium]|jgi:MFS family permease|nr:MFS transporter [Coriobacteriales bacterium]